MITQQQLYLHLQFRDARRQGEAMRLEIVNSLANGAPIQAGELTAYLREVSSRRISWKIIEQMWGNAAVDSLKPQVPATISRQLIILPTPQWTDLPQ